MEEVITKSRVDSKVVGRPKGLSFSAIFAAMGSLIVLIAGLVSAPLKAREARSVMQASATVKAGCMARTTPLIREVGSSKVKNSSRRARGTASIKIRCAKNTPFEIRLRGATPKARATLAKLGKGTGQIFKSARIRTYRAKAGAALRLLASASLASSRYSSRKGKEQLIVAINF